MRNISFSHTERQILDGSKSVTRRRGWVNLLPGTLLRAVHKGRGLKPGQHPRELATIVVLDVRREPVGRLLEPGYGDEEARRKGFPNLTGAQFYAYLVAQRLFKPLDVCTRIEFTDKDSPY